jgi:hypothetical protein
MQADIICQNQYQLRWVTYTGRFVVHLNPLRPYQPQET